MTDTAPESFISDGSVRDSYRQGWRLILTSFGILLAITFVFLIIRAPADSSEQVYRRHQEIGIALGIFSGIYGVLVAGPLSMGYAWMLLKKARGEEPRWGDMFAAFRVNYGNAVGAGILTVLAVVGGLVLLIVPGIIIGCRLAFVSYLIVDRRMDAVEALRTSWRMTKGHAGTIFRMILMAIPVIIAGLIVLLVGVVVSTMWINAAFAVYYRRFDEGEAATQVGTENRPEPEKRPPPRGPEF